MDKKNCGGKGFVLGANFLPSTAANPVEMWRKDLFDPDTIRKELKLAAAWGVPCSSFSEIQLPVKLEDYHLFERDKKELRRNFFFANYKEVLEYLGGKSRAVWVTLLLVICSIFFSSAYDTMVIREMLSLSVGATVRDSML